MRIGSSIEGTRFESNYEFVFKLLLFVRDGNGSPDYAKGLMDAEYKALLNIVVDTTKPITEDEAAKVNDSYENWLYSLRTKLHNTVLVDNDDAFFRNLIAPHAYETFNQLFTEEDPLWWTSEIVPPPARLNFPMLVGNNEARLNDDLQAFLAYHIQEGLRGIRFDLGGTVFGDGIAVTIVKMEAFIDNWRP